MEIHLQPKQWKLLNLLQATGKRVPTIIGGGGAKGGGKSAGARNIAILLASLLGDKYKGLVITVVRRVAADLRDNHINPLFKAYPELLKYWRAGDHDLVMPNGARIIFRSAETHDDVKRKFLGGFESAIIIVDEAQQFTQEELQWIQAAARWTDGKGIPEGLCKLLLLFNPGGPGSPYIRRIFWTHEYEPNENAKDYAFVHVFGWDNYEWFRGQVDLTEEEFYKIPGVCNEGNGGDGCRCCRFHMFISQTSEGRKYNAFPASIRAGYLLGSFDNFEGQYFAGAWDGSLCVISHPLAESLRQPWWTHWMSMDWGWSGPPRPHYSVNLWWAIGKLAPSVLMEKLGIVSEYPLDVIIIYRARHACLTPEEQWAQQIVDATPEKERRVIARHFVDGAVFSTDRRSANTTADLMRPALAQAELPTLEPADKDRIGGWRQLYNALVRTCNARRSAVREDLDGPLLLVSAEVPGLIKGLPMLICDEDRPEDVLKTEAIEDDYADCARYGYKSMLEAQWQAPRDIRAKQVYDSIQGNGADVMTARHMAMIKFQQDNPVNRSGVPARWRGHE